MSPTTCQTRNSFLLQESLRVKREGGRKTEDWAEGGRNLQDHGRGGRNLQDHGRGGRTVRRGAGIYKIMVVGTCEGSKEVAGLCKGKGR